MSMSKLARAATDVLISRATWGGSQNFLGARWVERTVAHAPAPARERVALRFLSLSPHYFYGRDLTAEAERNRRSRQILADELIAPHLTPDARVLDYGCGPGYLAAAVARRAAHVDAVDISRGTLACARVLNGLPNVTYRTPEEFTASGGPVDLAYSFAVIQHLRTDVLVAALALLAGAVRPGGGLLLHFAVTGELGYRTEGQWLSDGSMAGRAKIRYGLNCFGRSPDELAGLVTRSGFTDVATSPLSGSIAIPDDDIPNQHLLTARRASAAEDAPTQLSKYSRLHSASVYTLSVTISATGDLSSMRERLYESYASQHSGQGSAEATRVIYQRDIRPLLPPPSAGPVVDIGCGSGELVRCLQAGGYDAAGIDISPEQVALARKSGLASVRAGDYRELLREYDGGLAAVTATDLLEHLTKPEVLAAFDVVAAALRPGGRFIARVPNAGSPFGGHIRYGDFTHETWYTARSVRQLAAAAGFGPVTVAHCPPPAHGVRSAIRAVLWKPVSGLLQLALAIETGVVHGHIVTQNLTFAAVKPQGR